MKNITFDGYDLQTSNIIVSEVKQFDSFKRDLNIQGFAYSPGGKLLNVKYPPKEITISGILRGSSAQDLEERMDDMKKYLANGIEGNLTMDYVNSTRTFICTCQGVEFERNHFTIDAIDFQTSFIASDPPFAIDTTYTTLNAYGKTNSGATTATYEHTGAISHLGTVSPSDIIKITINSCVDVSKINFINTNADGETTETQIYPGYDFSPGDIIQIDIENGKITLNGSDIDFLGGFPKFTLLGNNWTLRVVGISYNIDVKFTYYKMWL